MVFSDEGGALLFLKCSLILLIHFLLTSCGVVDLEAFSDKASQSDSNLIIKPTPTPISIFPTQAVQKFITVDQFGYRPGDKKVAVIKNPQVGLDSGTHFTPSSTIELRKVEGNLTVANLSPVAWNSGATHVQSGDKGWWVDFSSVTTSGTYYLLDVVQNVRSPIFKIEENVYKELLKTAVRTYFYERSGFAKTAPYAENCWTDSAAYLKPDQDSQAEDLRHYKTPGSYPSLKRDLSGGWFDAGDMNKYTTFAAKSVSSLLTAYSENPTVFSDDFNIPESGNGIPDVLDEVMYELEWVKKMQNANGSLALKVGKIVETLLSDVSAPPSKDTDRKYYIGECTSSTIAGASMFAHAAFVFRNIPALQVEAALLQSRAVSAWNNFIVKYNANSLETNCDDLTIHAGDADIGTVDEQKAHAVIAAVYLFALTGELAYESYINSNYTLTRPFNDMGWSRYEHDQGDALLVYTKLSNSNATLRNTIYNRKLNDILYNSDKVYTTLESDDLYRAYLHDDQHHWGSNMVRSNYGNSVMNIINYQLMNNTTFPTYRERALGIIHYIHGVNPFGWTYLTNMYSLGATNSINKIYNGWFAPETKWSDAKTSQCGPIPGLLAGGPNKSTNVCSSGGCNNLNACTSGTKLNLQPMEKAYRDTNIGWNYTTMEQEYGWELTENAIYYQGAYIRLLANFAKPSL